MLIQEKPVWKDTNDAGGLPVEIPGHRLNVGQGHY
jgi:hypothetical protein